MEFVLGVLQLIFSFLSTAFLGYIAYKRYWFDIRKNERPKIVKDRSAESEIAYLFVVENEGVGDAENVRVEHIHYFVKEDGVFESIKFDNDPNVTLGKHNLVKKGDSALIVLPKEEIPAKAEVLDIQLASDKGLFGIRFVLSEAQSFDGDLEEILVSNPS